MLAINISTPKSIMQDLKDKFKQKRLSLNLTQEGLSNKSGVSLGSIKRFESSGEISFESLLKIALVLNCLDDFKNIANEKDEQYESMEDLLKIKPIKKRGVIK
ncbi:helix-turn-helix domain-containing protein [Aliarcobacter butzleri]|uniref:helix-turn-helix domain-containing protein n=1 Tax=Aliarcobacter butzleri TaxID=28197 RepID=UPI0021B39456|nr:helix-turn-helix transcriptional regulator [Aliarcobacter butzleri]MCT7564081.1 helix-turn-helix domain-containing protein [Aliarcobacter butzleri]MCT7613067.1 helix-turn-helix domain-containing protein [Aliarcobacter butzleri]MCT7621975.1 helix-turn-helix domain-containing protein [Aliarcobacter butzleri]MCT7641701.1 helix-turn-helix domain-containing protein [Aliarcobacter butzleri]MDN5092070.1 helix-turn-helix transcriptional regulator [Aliarcobacter butzleri]